MPALIDALNEVRFDGEARTFTVDFSPQPPHPDIPSQELDAIDTTVAEGKTSTVSVDFKTAVLEVRIEAKGQGGTGMVTVKKEGRRIGTLGSGVAARLSAGSYEIIVRLGGREQRHQVELRPGQRRLVRAQF